MSVTLWLAACGGTTSPLAPALPTAVAPRLEGTLSSGRGYRLQLGASSLVDVWPVAGGALFVTAAGSLGHASGEPLVVRHVMVPPQRLRGFVEGADRPLVFDDTGRVHAVNPDPLTLEPIGNPLSPAPQWVAQTGDPFVGVHISEDRLAVQVRADHVEPVEGSVWHASSTGLWWGEDRGEWGGSFGRVGGPEHHRATTGFAPVGGRLLAYGGLEHLGLRRTWIVDAESGALLFASDAEACGPGTANGPCDPIEWLIERSEGQVDVLTRHGHRYTAQVTDDAVSEWMWQHQVRVQSLAGRSHSVGHRTGLNAVRRGPEGALWAATWTDGLLRLDEASGDQAAALSMAPRAADLRHVHHQLWAADAAGRVFVFEDDQWVQQTPNLEGLPDNLQGRALGQVVDPADGAVWWWRIDGEPMRLLRATTSGHAFLEDRGPVEHVFQTPDGRVMFVSQDCQGAPGCLPMTDRLPVFPQSRVLRWLHAGGPPYVLSLGWQWWQVHPDRLTGIQPPRTRGRSVHLPLADGGWWVLEERGLYRVDASGQPSPHPTPVPLGEPYAMAQVGDALWIAGQHGIGIRDDAGVQILRGLPELGVVTDIEALPNGRVAIACEQGILWIDA